MIINFRPTHPQSHRYRAEEITGPLPSLLYKVISEPYATRFVKFGEMMWSTLTWFQHEEDPDRGDRLEGTRTHFPVNGLDLHRLERDGRPDEADITLRLHGFQSKAKRSHRIFIYSTTLDPALLVRPTSSVARVESFDPTELARRVRLALDRHHRAHADTFIYDEVAYWSSDAPPKEAWALPHKLTMLKHERYRAQREYRFALGTSPDVFDFENVELSIRTAHDRPTRVKLDPKAHRLKLRLGSLDNCCRLLGTVGVSS